MTSGPVLILTTINLTKNDMTKHIHIHLPSRKTKTGDAVKHDPSNGQFTSGVGGGNAAHHEARAEEHRNNLLTEQDDSRIPHHAEAMAHHLRAAHELRKREDLGAGGDKHAHASLQAAAEANAKAATQAESKLVPSKKPTTSERQAMLREMGSPRHSGRIPK